MVVALALLAFSDSALARNVYVTNSGDGTVSALDAKTNAVVGTIGVGGEPVDVAISPDGTRAYVANKGSDAVDVIDTSTNAQVATIPVGKKPDGIAVTPNGQRAYVANFGGTVSVIDAGANATLGAPVAVGKEPEGVAISPDGSLALVAQRGGDITVVSTGANAPVNTIVDPLGPSRIAIEPRGGRGFVTDSEASSVTAFNPASGGLVGAPIPIGTQPAGIAIGPGGNTAYVASPVTGSVTPVDTSLDSALSAPVGGFPGATGVAIDPNGLQGYVTDGVGSSVTVLDAVHNVAAGSIGVGLKPTAVAVAPDQGPHAAFWVSPISRRARTKLTFHGSNSTDVDGKVDVYAWDFGDGTHAEGPEPTRFHNYRHPGEYRVTLKVTDDEGCSTEQVFTGQTVSCNGSQAAVMSIPIRVADFRGPVLHLRGAGSQRLGGRVSVLVRCPREPCGVQARGAVATAVEGGGRTLRSAYRLIGAEAARPSAGWRKLVLRLPGSTRRAASRALREGGAAKARISVIARDEDGDLALQRREVKLVP